MPRGVVQWTATPPVATIDLGTLVDEEGANGQVAFAGGHVEGGTAVVIAKINVIGSDFQNDIHALQVAKGGGLQQLAAFGEFVSWHEYIRVFAHAHLDARVETGFRIAGIVHAVHIAIHIHSTFAMVTGRYSASTAGMALTG